MGTRADFYVGRGKDAEWIGSIAWDGYRDGIDNKVLFAETEKEYREAVADFVGKREDGTTPEMGWPWPWNDSGTTDCAYAFDDGMVWQAHYDDVWLTARDEMPEDAPEGMMRVEWPDMTNKKKVATVGTKRSGTMAFRIG